MRRLISVILAAGLLLAAFAAAVGLLRGLPRGPGGPGWAPVSAASSSLTCAVKASCDAGEVAVFRMSGLANAHVQTVDGHPSAYGYTVCCAGPGGLGAECSVDAARVLRFSSPDNAHVAEIADMTYEIPVCLSAPTTTLDCYYDTAPTCADGYACLATISGSTNAHVADCDGVGSYGTRVCCGTAPPAVLLMHGWQLPWQGANCGSMEQLRVYLRDQLAVPDNRVQCFGYDPDEGVKRVAAQLSKRVASMKSELGLPDDQKIDLVAHSFGGLVSRYYVEKLGGARDVAGLTMLGTPNSGVWVAELPVTLCSTSPPGTLRAMACGGAILEYLFDKAAWDMRPSSGVIRELNQGFTAPSTQYEVVAGTADGPLGWILYLGAPNDCVVSTASAQGPGLPMTLRPVIHIGLPSWLCAATSNLLNDAVVFADVLAAIDGAAASSGTARATEPPQATANGEQTAPFAGLSVDVIHPAAVQQHTVQVESGTQTAFSAMWLSSDTLTPDLHLTLQSPSGTVVDGSAPGVTYNPPAGPVWGGMMLESYLVDSPEAGEWILRVEGVDLPSEGLSYVLLTSLNSPITITSSLDEGSYAVGDVVLGTVAVKDGASPVTDATVSANAVTPSGQELVEFHDDGLDGDNSAGDGVYSALFSGTSSCGLYRFDITASGAAGSFTRQDVLFTDVHVPGDAAGDPCVADDDSDGCTDTQELAMTFDPLNPYDFYDVPVPARADPSPNGARNQVVDIGDALAVILYAFTEPTGNCGDNPNANGVDYDCDKDNSGMPDGVDYDRSPSAEPNPPWDAGPPNGVIDIGDVLAALAQFGLDCSEAP